MTKICLVLLLISAIFKNISYPLLWGDESMTSVSSERVLAYGYPKINDGKNVVYDLRHSNKRLGANESLDAYVGGAGWFQYYVGAIGCIIADRFENIYVKTGILRTYFAIFGLLGLFILIHFFANFIKDKIAKELFYILFLLFTISSVSLLLIIREVRYYSLVFLVLYAILTLYYVFRYNNARNNKIFITSMAILHPLCIITFSPIYFILFAFIGIMESIFFMANYKKSGLRSAYEFAKPVITAGFISFFVAVPLLYFFKTFEINKAMSEFNGYTSTMYFNNLKTAFNYFFTFEYLLLAICIKLFQSFYLKDLWLNHKSNIKISLSLTLFFILYLLSISRMHGVMYTRYIIYLQPILTLIILFDLFSLIEIIKNSLNKFKIQKISLIILFTVIFFSYKVYTNKALIQGHFYQMTHQYEGPLDKTIPFIIDKYPDPKSLVIATNYEETSYMYYLKSKVIIGYVGNNLTNDLKYEPDLISYRYQWGDEFGVFANYINKYSYYVKRFEIVDSPTNMISEFNYRPPYTHKFKTVKTETLEEATQLWINNKLDRK